MELSIIAGMVIAGLIFFLIVQAFVFHWGKETAEYGYKAEAENIAFLINRIYDDPGNYLSYCQEISLSNISIKNGILTYEKNGMKFSFFVPITVNESRLIETTSICIIKSGRTVNLFSEKPICNLDNVCTLEECKWDCLDCYADQICYGDGICNKLIGENCKNSVDCSCGNKKCCPSSKDADDNGCSKIFDLDKGQECWCSNQCKSGLECNFVVPGFMSFQKACCEQGKSWNGSECIVVECKYPCISGCKLPEKWDWRNVNGINYLNPVRDQGSCGSCWAFSAIGAIEGTYNVEKNCPACNRDLSEQQLVSNSYPCCGSCGDCGGGFPSVALNYAKSNGVCDESCFPYVAATVSCGVCSDWSKRLWKIDFGAISSNLDEIKRAVICYGPLSVSSINWRHAVVLIGYDDTTQRWIIRNSWGRGWAFGGYGYIPYSGHIYSDIRNYVYYVKDVKEP